MFWRSVVGKLVITILLLVSFVLFILTVLLLQFFENFHIQEAENNMMQSAAKISTVIEDNDNKETIMNLTEIVKESSTKVIVFFEDGELWESKTTNPKLGELGRLLPNQNPNLQKVISSKKNLKERETLFEDEAEIMVVATPVKNKNAGVVVYQTLDVVNQTKAQTTKIILLLQG